MKKCLLLSILLLGNLNYTKQTKYLMVKGRCIWIPDHSFTQFIKMISFHQFFLKNLRYIKLQQDPKLIKEGGFSSVLVIKKNQFLTCSNEHQQSFAILPIKIIHIIRAWLLIREFKSSYNYVKPLNFQSILWFSKHSQIPN